MVEIIGHTKDKEKQRLKRDNYMEGQLMEKAILYAINERMFSLGLIDEKTRDKRLYTHVLSAMEQFQAAERSWQTAPDYPMEV